MNLSYNWLKELVPFDLNPQELAEQLTRVGCCVEEIEAIDDDWMLTAEVTTNRPDWLCHWGIAHEIAAFTNLKLNLPEIKLPEDNGEKITDLTSVENKAEDLCPRYTARIIKGVKITPSPDWLQKRLLSVGLKPRNNVVDITNLVLFETNQPLHAFDYDLLKENRIIVRTAEEGEKFTSVFDEERKLKNSMCVIADAEKTVALAGVKGGKDTGVHDGTVNILLESAYFNQASTRKASQATQLDSDSSYRFERGIDPGAVAESSARAVQLICDIAGGKPAAGIIDTNPDLASPKEVKMRFTRCTKLLGTRVDPRKIEKIFIGLGLEPVEKTPAHICVKVPTFRGDITREADLIEEVARCHGYEHIPTKIDMPQTMAHISKETSCIRKATEILTGLGYNEAMTDTFVEEKWVNEFAPAATADFNGDFVKINNPIREDRPFMRVSLAPSLLEVRRVNREIKEAGFFEINRTYASTSTDNITEELHLCITDDRGIEYVKGAFEKLLHGLHISGEYSFSPADGEKKGLLAGSITEIKIADKLIGISGIISEKTINTHDLLSNTAILEINFSVLIKEPQLDFKFKPLPRFPGIARDIALVVNEETRWTEIEKAVLKKPEMIEHVEFASCYRGKQLKGGMKSMAFSIHYRNPEKSFTDEEANELRDNMVNHLTSTFAGSSIRK